MSLLKLLLSDDGIHSDVSHFSKLESYYIVQRTKKILNDSFINGIVEKIKNELKKNNITFTIAGSYIRKNLFIESISVVCCSQKISETLKLLYDKFSGCDIDSKNGNMLRIIQREGKCVQIAYSVVHPSEYVYSIIKNTGSRIFFTNLSNYAQSKGINLESIKAKTEEEFFSRLGIPYVPPDLRECNFDLEIPYECTLLKNAPTFDLSNDYKTKIDSNGGVLIDIEDFILFGDSILLDAKNNNPKSLLGIKLSCLSQYDPDKMKKFDYVYSRYFLSSSTVIKMKGLIDKIDKPLILYDFGIDLSTSLRLAEMRINWVGALKSLANKKVVLSLNNSFVNLHPFILNKLSNAGINFILSSFGKNNQIGFNLARKALISKKSILSNEERIINFIKGKI
jgi:hypothetical protein